jgi:hypothetical protein
MRSSTSALALTGTTLAALLVIATGIAALAPAARADIASFNVGPVTVADPAVNTAGTGWSWDAATKTLMLANGAAITGGIDFTAADVTATTGTNWTTVNIITAGTVSVAGGIGAGTDIARYDPGVNAIRLTVNGPLTLSGGFNGWAGRVASGFIVTTGSANVTGGLNAGLIAIGAGAALNVSGTLAGNENVALGSLLIAGGTATITSTGTGETDAYALGGLDDFTLLAGAASLTGHVDVDGGARIHAGTVAINGDIESTWNNVILTGGTLALTGNILGSAFNGTLGVLAGKATVGGAVTGDLIVKGGAVTVAGPVGGATVVTAGVSAGAVSVDGATVAPAPAATVTIALNTLSTDTDNSADGWGYDATAKQLTIYGTEIPKNYTLTGSAAAGVSVFVDEDVHGTVTLANATLDTSTLVGSTDSALDIAAPGLVLAITGTVTLVGSDEGILYEGDSYGGIGAPLVLDLAAGAVLNTTGGPGFDGIYCIGDGLLVRGAGTLNARGGDTSGDNTAYTGLYIGGALIAQDSVTINATGANYAGADAGSYGPYSGFNDGITCSALSITGSAKVNAIGGNSPGTGSRAGTGVVVWNGVIHVASTAANALTATGGTDNVDKPGFGAGIQSNSDLHLTGAGEITVLGDHAIVSDGNLFLAAGKLTATARTATGYALYAAAWDGNTDSPLGGVVTIAAGAVTAANTATPANTHHRTLNHVAGTYNGKNPDGTPAAGGGGTGGGDTGGNSGGGGGGGGAPTPLALAAILALLALRATRKK